MKRAAFVRIAGMLGLAGCLTLVLLLSGSRATGQVRIPDTAPQLTTTPTATATTFPQCDQRAEMSLALSEASPQLGRRITATVTLTNAGDCSMGLPLYTLRIDNEHAVAAQVEGDNPVLHSLGIGGGRSDSVAFRLMLLNTGLFTLTANASFEVHVGYPGPAYWSRAATGPITFTVPAATTGDVIMTQAAYAAGCMVDSTVESTLLISPTHFSCAIAAGHSIGADMTEYVDPAAARAEFLAQAAGHEIQPFAACRPSFSTEEPGLGPMVIKRETWRGEQWLVTGVSADDTPSLGGTTGAWVVHDALLANDLLEPCRHCYLPRASTR